MSDSTRPRTSRVRPADALDVPAIQDDSGRDTAGRWRPGVSGSRNGSRPRGVRALLEVIGPKAREQVWRVVLDLALSGDLSACKLLLDRTDPVQRAVTLDATVRQAQPMLDLTVLTDEELRELMRIAEKAQPDAAAQARTGDEQLG